jgi:hypothetical protein
MFRIEGVTLPGLENEVTRAVWLGDSIKSVEEMLTSGARVNRSTTAKELILDILDAEGDKESDALDAQVAQATGLAAGTVRQLRGVLKNEGLVKAFPEKDETGAILRWLVGRTLVPREDVQ